jgi:peptide/nickel transport system permease protein
MSLAPMAVSIPRRPGLLRLRTLDNLSRKVLKDRYVLVALGFFILVVATAVLAPWVMPYDPNAQDLLNRLAPPFWSAGGSVAHPLGTDELGRDVMTRVVWGARTSLAIGASVVAVTSVIGVAFGLLAGNAGGRVDSAIMRVVDIMFAFPGLLIAMTIVLVIGPSAKSIVTALTIDGWLVYCRLTRGMMLSLRETTFMEAARCMGCSPLRMMLRHALPNIVSPLLTLATLEFARVVLAESTLSFLGLGVQPPAASWGLMLNTGEDYLTVAWWMITFPGLALTLTVLSANVLASWLRVVTDPLQR